MDIMVSKRYMRKYDTCVGHEARINKLLLKKPPNIKSAGSAASVCEQCADQPSNAFTERGRKKEGNKRQLKYKMWTEEEDELWVWR